MVSNSFLCFYYLIFDLIRSEIFNKVCWLSHTQVLSSQQKITEGRPTFNETFLFHWVEAARIDWRSLKSVAEPSMYLFYEDNENKVTINPVAMPDFRIEGIFVKMFARGILY